MDNEYSGNNLFDIEDIEHSISCLRNGRSCGADGLSKENIVHSYPSLNFSSM